MTHFREEDGKREWHIKKKEEEGEKDMVPERWQEPLHLNLFHEILLTSCR